MESAIEQQRNILRVKVESMDRRDARYVSPGDVIVNRYTSTELYVLLTLSPYRNVEMMNLFAGTVVYVDATYVTSCMTYEL